jgi:hypothetical protein
MGHGAVPEQTIGYAASPLPVLRKSSKAAVQVFLSGSAAKSRLASAEDPVEQTLLET